MGKPVEAPIEEPKETKPEAETTMEVETVKKVRKIKRKESKPEIVEPESKDVEETTDVQETISIRKPKEKSPETVEETISIQKPKDESPETVEETISIRKPKEESPETVEETISIRKPKDEEPKEEIKPETETTMEVETVKKVRKIKRKESKPKIVEPESKDVEETTDVQETISIPKPKEKSPETVEETFSIRKPKDDTPEEVSKTLTLKKPKEESDESVQETILIQKPKDEEPQEETKPETETTLEVETVKKVRKIKRKESKPELEKPESKDAEETTDVLETISIRKPTEETPEDVSETLTIKKPKEDSVESVQETIMIRKPKEESSEEVSETMTIRKKEAIVEESSDKSIVLKEETAKETTKKLKIKRKGSKPEALGEKTDDKSVDESVILRKPIDESSDAVETLTLPKSTESDSEMTHHVVSIKSRKDSTESVEENVTLKKDRCQSSETVEESATIKLEKPAASDSTTDDEETVVKLRKPSLSSSASIESRKLEYDEISTDITIKRKSKKSKEVSESMSITLPPRPPKYTTVEADAELRVQRHVKVEEESKVVSAQLCQEMVCKVAFEPQTSNAISLREGDRIYVVERINQDWWFVRKKITNQTGMVPSDNVVDTVSYTHYISKSVDEVVDKLPVTEYAEFTLVLRPKVEEIPDSEITCQIGERLEIQFSVTGRPRPYIVCFKESKIMQTNERFQLYYNVDNVVTMRFNDLLPHESGLYTVVAKNHVGSCKCSFNIMVEGQVAFDNEEAIKTQQQNLTETQNLIPMFSKIPERMEIDVDAAFTVQFTVFSYEKARVRLVKNDVSVLHQERFTVKETEVEKHLYQYEFTCERSTESDDGMYEILAENPEGEASATIEMFFRHKRQKPSFVRTFTETKVGEGNQLLLEVQCKGYPRPKLFWFHEENRILSSSNTIIRQKDFDGILAISNVSKQLHEGHYTCRAENIAGDCSHTESVQIYKRTAKFLERLRDVEVYENEKTLLAVKITSTEEDVVWLKDGNEIDIESNNYEFLKDGHYRKLLIEKANVSHQGEYTCVLGSEQCSSDLVIIEMAPEITRKLKDVNIICGEDAQFVVELSKGDAVLQWFKNGKPIQLDDRVQLQIDGKQQKLVIHNANMEDAGEYSCQLANQQSKSKLLIQTPSTEFIVRLPEEYTVDEECEALFEVEISRPDVDVYWYKNGEELRETSNVKFIVQKTVRKLLIRRAKMTDTGEYICLAKGDQTKTVLSVSKEPIVFNLKLKDINIKEGETATLSTEVIDARFEVVWYKNNEPLVTDERIIVSESGKHRKLIIKNASPTDKGTYTAVCEGQRSSSKVSVLSPPKVLIDSRRYTAAKSDNFAIEVPFEGYPVPKVEWYYAGRLLKTSKKVALEILMSRTVLTIKNVDEADVGLYKLCLENSVGQFTTHFELFLIDRPDPPSKPVALNVANNSLILKWEEPKKNNGSPITNYVVEYREAKSSTWKEYDEFIGEENVKIKNLKHNSTYAFRVYSINKAGKSNPSTESDLITMQEIDEGEEPTIIQKLPASLHTMPFGTTKLECKVTGKPTPTLEWSFNNEVIDASDTECGYIIKFDKNVASLLIKECRFDLAGKYKLVASNEFGQASTSTTVVVEEKPYAKFDSQQVVVKVKQGNTHQIFCQVYGYPYPEIIWYKGGVSISRRENVSVANTSNLSVLSIENVAIEDSGIYTLHLINPAGESKYDFEVKMLNRPGPPDLPIRCTNCDDHSVEVSWNPPKDDGGSPILFYKVEICETKFIQWTELTQVTADNFSHKVYDLLSGSKYRFRISSINEFGVSEPVISEPIICKSPFDRPSPPSGPIRTSDHTQSSFVLYWNPPEHDGNSPILEYTVEIREENRKTWRKVGSVDGETLSLLVEELTNEMSYYFRITCRNKIGTSDPFCSEESVMVKCRFGAPTVPMGPLCVTEMTNTSLTLAWKPPLSNGGLELTGYIIERKLSFENNWIREAMLEPDVLHYTVRNLFAKYEYNFRVMAENALGQSPPLEGESAVQLTQNATPPGVPSAPLEMRSVSPSAIVIEWGKPENDGGAPLTGYVIAAREARRTMWMEVGKVSADIHRLQIKDLQEGRSYQVRVLAQNEIGLSDPLESEEAIQVVRPPGFNESEAEGEVGRDETLSMSFTTSETTSWMREANVEANVESYTRHSLLRRREYFFKVWFYADKLFK